MNEDRSRDSNSTESTLDASPAPAKMSARRRFLVSGAKLAPVVAATLASRPSLAAAQCVMPSAWGSVALAVGGQDMGAVGTLTGSISRFHVRSLNNNPYPISAWLAGDAPWTDLVAKYAAISPGFPSAVADTDKVAYLKGLYKPPLLPSLTVGALCGHFGFSPPAGGANATPLRAIKQGGFIAAVLVAEFNVVLGKVVVGDSECLPSTDVLSQMAKLTYKPAGSSQTWTKQQVTDYLYFNYLAR